MRAPPLPMTRTSGSRWLGPVETVRHEGGQLVIRQRPSRLVRYVRNGWGVLTLIMAVILVDGFRGTTTRLTCSRASGRCQLDGDRKPFAIADVAEVELRRYHVHKIGDASSITVHMRDGKSIDLDMYGAHHPGAVDSYRRAADALRAFLADPSQATLDTSFTYRAGTWETLRTAGLLGFGLLSLVFAILYLPTKVSTFAQDGARMATRSLLRRATYPVTSDQITAVVDRKGPAGHVLGLDLADASTVVVLFSEGPDPLGPTVAEVLGKPLRSA